MTYSHHLEAQVLHIILQGDMLGLNKELQLLDFADQHIQQDIKHCVLDLTHVTYMNSTGISIMIRMLTRFRNVGGDVILVNPNESVAKLFIITKLNTVFTIVPTTTEAVEFLKNRNS